MKNRLLISILIITLNINAQENKTTFGLQYKPIIPSKYFNSSHINKNLNNYNLALKPEYSNKFGMIIRHRINKTFSMESGLNYTQRNYQLSIKNNILNLSDFTVFGIRSYEIPVQILTYVRATKKWYLNVAFGLSQNILASDVKSYGEKNESYFQNTYRKSSGYRALLANIGMEYRTELSGDYYIGASLHMPWSEIGRIYPEYKGEGSSFNDVDFNDQIFLEITGNFITIDLRYFFKN